MTSFTPAIARGGNRLSTRVLDYVELTKPRIVTLVLVVVATAAYIARWGQPDLSTLVHALLGSLFVAGSASAMNQLLERQPDGVMRRTAARPLPAGRLSGGETLFFSTVTCFGGVLYLGAATNWTASGFALLTWVLYALVYTPLKRVTAANTIIGAVAGALPMLIGWSAVGGRLDAMVDPRGWAMFLILFLWQFPHFMAIAWIYRAEYARAGFQMLTVVDPSGRQAALQCVSSALILVPLSLVPALLIAGPGLWVHLAITAALGAALLVCSLRFARSRDERSARLLLRATLLYLPLVLLCLVLATLE
jgi:protoheme IX farnesyltransferase